VGCLCLVHRNVVSGSTGPIMGLNPTDYAAIGSRWAPSWTGGCQPRLSIFACCMDGIASRMSVSSACPSRLRSRRFRTWA